METEWSEAALIPGMRDMEEQQKKQVYVKWVGKCF